MEGVHDGGQAFESHDAYDRLNIRREKARTAGVARAFAGRDQQQSKSAQSSVLPIECSR
jgi:hypothetical protein